LAVASEIRTALSQVSLVIGWASSCSQALLANRPSKTFGSTAKAISRPVPAGASSGAAVCASACPLTVGPLSAPAPVSGTMPSASQRSVARRPDGYEPPDPGRAVKIDLGKASDADKIADLMDRQGQLHEALENAITDLEEVLEKMKPEPEAEA